MCRGRDRGQVPTSFWPRGRAHDALSVSGTAVRWCACDEHPQLRADAVGDVGGPGELVEWVVAQTVGRAGSPMSAPGRDQRADAQCANNKAAELPSQR